MDVQVVLRSIESTKLDIESEGVHLVFIIHAAKFLLEGDERYEETKE